MWAFAGQLKSWLYCPRTKPVQTGFDLRLIFSYAGAVSNARSCRVSFTDASGVTHTVKITAASLFEAAILGLAELRRCTMVEDAPGPAAKFTIAVESPCTVHEVPMQKLTAWLESNGKSPAEQAVKVRLREALRR
jgi:hypothetical protein